MNLGFYYHIPLHSSVDELKTPAYLGVFLDSLAYEVKTLTLFMHEANSDEVKHCDYILKAKNIRYLSLGLKSPAWHRFLWPANTLKKIKHNFPNCDILLVRAPSPLAPAFYHEFHHVTKVIYLVVGDYVVGAENLDQPWWRKIPIKILSKRNDTQLSEVLKNCMTLVNSTALFNKYKSSVTNIHEVKTTTLSESDIYIREDTCQNEEIRLLYAGSFSFAKGLHELLKAFSILRTKHQYLSLHFVGWEYDKQKPVEKSLKDQASKLGILKHITFHGFKTVGPELNAMYRKADIYIIPSYHEGFPRTIWEAMANSLPVIATKVGSIPYFLSNGNDAILIEPKNIEQIVDSTLLIITNHDLRRKLICNGRLLAKENTLEIQTKRILNLIKETDNPSSFLKTQL